MGLILMVDSDEILMDSNQEFLHVHLLNQFVHDFTKLKKTFDDKSGKLWQRVVLFGLLQKAEEHAKNVSMITIFKHPEHRRVQILKNKLSFLVLSNFVEVVNEQPSEKLFNEIVNTLLGDFPHDLLGRARFIDDGDEVLGESKRNVLNLVSENIFHHHSEGIDKLIAAINQSLQLILLLRRLLGCIGAAGGGDDLVQGNE